MSTDLPLLIILPRDQGRIIHEAGEAEASGPDPDRPVQRKFYTVIPLWAPKFLERKFAVF